MAGAKKQAAEKPVLREMVMVPLKELRANPKNPKTHPEEQVDALVAAIKEWGWTQPILCTADREVVAGHGRLMAAERMNLEVVPAIICDGWTPEQIQAYVIADNKLTELGEWDDGLLAISVKELQDADFDMSLLAIEPDELQDMLATGGFLGDLAEGDEEDGDGRLRKGPGAAGTVTLTFHLSPHDRDTIVAHLSKVRDKYELATTAAALMRLATKGEAENGKETSGSGS